MQSGGAVRQGPVPGEHGVNSPEVPMPRQRLPGDPHLVVVAALQQDSAVGVECTPTPGGLTCASGPAVYRSTISRRLGPLSRAVQISQAARLLYGGMLKVSALSCGAGRSRPPGLDVGTGSVGGAMSVCAQARCGTLIRPWSGWCRLSHQIHTSMRLSRVRSLGVKSAWSCRTQIRVGPCGKGPTAKRVLGRAGRPQQN